MRDLWKSNWKAIAKGWIGVDYDNIKESTAEKCIRECSVDQPLIRKDSYVSNS